VAVEVTMREAFEQSLADYHEVKVIFVDHPALVVPDGVRPEPGGLELLRAGTASPESLAGKTQSLATSPMVRRTRRNCTHNRPTGSKKRRT
jgi:hypothetical protein